jgi:CHAT domain-containing protein
LAALVCVALARAHAPDDQQDLLEPGRRFTAELTLDAEADAKLFQSAGLDRSKALLTAVMLHGQRPEATSADWSNLHRATAGLVELAIQNGETFRASMLASFQSMFYRTLERDYSRALPASRQALELQQKSAVTANLDIAWSAVGANLLSLGRPDEALESFRQAQRLEADPVATRSAVNWRTIVQTELARKAPGDAKRELDRFLDLARGAPAYYRAEALMAQADTLIAEGRHGQALDSVKAARQAVKGDAKAEAFETEVLNLLLTCVLDSMNAMPYAEALALAGRIDTEFAGLPIQIALFARTSLRTRRRLAGDIEGALREDTARREAGRRGGNVPLQIEALRSVATTYRSFHSVTSQITALEEAAALEKSLLPPDGVPAGSVASRNWARALILLGNAYADARQIGKSGRAFQDAIRSIDTQASASIKKGLQGLRGQAVLGKARVAVLDEDPDSARELLQAAMAAMKDGGSYDRSDVLLQMARLEREERPDEATQFYREAILAMQAGRNSRSETLTHLEAARFLALRGKLPEAQIHVDAAASGALAGNFAAAQWRVAFLGGLIAEKQGQDAEAVQHYAIGIRKLEAIRAGLSETEHRQSFADHEAVTELYQRMVGALTRLGRRDEAWQYVERGKARAFVEGLQGRQFREAIPPAAAAGLRELEKRMLSLRAQLAPANESILRGAGREPAVLQNDLNRLEEQFALARQQAGLSANRSSRATELVPPSIGAIQAKLPEDTALLEYFLLSDGLTVFVVTRDSVEQVAWKLDTKVLRGAVLRLRAVLADGNSADVNEIRDQVSEMVWKPVASRVGAVNRLVIVPAGWLNYLPFQALTHAGGTALIDRYSISYLPSASTLALLGEAPAMTSDLFLGALGNVSVEGWAPLPGTLREAEAIAKIYPEADRASEEFLTHDRAVKALGERRQVHLATHGLLDEHTPLFSALLMSPAPGQPSRLSLYELMDMDVKAKLVVLSACETGLGQLLGGDEVAGLTRTILSSGATTVVSSLWKVSDDATALLMQGFYRRLRAGDRAAEAMRAAALEVRKQYPHPFYWAPFVVTGAI